MEEPIVKQLLNSGCLVIASGGGGIPVVERESGELESVSAVIDKDFAACKMAEVIDADVLMILTAVDNVAINFGKPNQKNLTRLTVDEAAAYAKDGQFAAGSMLPKVEAAVNFVKIRPAKKAIIASLGNARDAVKGTAGTAIIA